MATFVRQMARDCRMRAGEVAGVLHANTHTHTHTHTHTQKQPCLGVGPLAAHTATEKSLSTSQRYITARCIERCLVFRNAARSLARSLRAAFQKSLLPNRETESVMTHGPAASWTQVCGKNPDENRLSLQQNSAPTHHRNVDVREKTTERFIFLRARAKSDLWCLAAWRGDSLEPGSPNFRKDGGVSKRQSPCLSVIGCQSSPHAADMKNGSGRFIVSKSNVGENTSPGVSGEQLII